MSSAEFIDEGKTSPDIDHVESQAIASQAAADNRAERLVCRKVDLHLMPMLCALLVLAFLDRINIGNARIQGLEKDLHMKGSDYNVALFIFFIPYILLEVPANIVMKRVRPSRWLCGLMVCWGIITICQGLTRSFAGLVVCRFLIGAFEAGFYPGCIYLIAMYYPRVELQTRMTFFFASGLIAGAFSGLLAYGIAHMNGDRGYLGWRWIFIFEGKTALGSGVFADASGLATVLISAVLLFFLPDWPHQAKFLNETEREILLQRLSRDSINHQNDTRTTGQIFQVVVRDIKVWFTFIMYFGGTITAYSTSFFIPTILVELGWTSYKAQYMSIPIYAVAYLVAVSVGLASDRFKHRFGFIVVFWGIAAIGYAILLAQRHVSPAVRYFAIYLIELGNFSAQPISLVWMNNNIFGHRRRGISNAFAISLGNIGGIVASNVFISSESPRFPAGYGTALGTCLLSMLAACGLLVYLNQQNNKKVAIEAQQDGDVSAGVSASVDEDNDPRIRYIL